MPCQQRRLGRNDAPGGCQTPPSRAGTDVGRRRRRNAVRRTRRRESQSSASTPTGQWSEPVSCGQMNASRIARGARQPHRPRPGLAIAQEQTALAVVEPAKRQHLALAAPGEQKQPNRGHLGVDPNSWTPDPLGRRYPPCRDQDRRTRRSSGARWLSWCEPDEVRKSCHESLSRRRRRSATGSCKLSVTRVIAGMGQAPRSERSCVAFAERIGACAKNETSWQKPRPGLLGGP